MKVYLLALLCLSLSTSAQTYKSIDIRDEIEDTKDTHLLTFSAHNDFPAGHAFVTWAGEDHTRKQSHSISFGMYAEVSVKNLAKMSFGPVPGKIRNEVLSGKIGAYGAPLNLRVQVSSKQFKRAESIRQSWEKKKDYQLLEQDCVTFMSEVAADLGLNLPKRASVVDFRTGIGRPFPFVEELIAINDGKKSEQISTPLNSATQDGASSNPVKSRGGLSAEEATLILGNLKGDERYRALYAIKNKISTNMSAADINAIIGNEEGSNRVSLIRLVADRLIKNTNADGAMLLLGSLEGDLRYAATYHISPCISKLSASDVDRIAGKEAKSRAAIIALISCHIK